jgi:hypothetical protein
MKVIDRSELMPEKNLEVEKKIIELFQQGKIKVDWNGHWLNRVTQPVAPPNYEYEFRREFGLEECVIDAVRTSWVMFDLTPLEYVLDNPGKKFVKYHPKFYHRKCHYCSKELHFEFNGEVMRVVNPCPYSEGYPAFNGELDIPSGVIVFANIFHFINDPPDFYPIEGIPEDHKRWDFYRKQGIFCGFCGNTCPSIKKKGDSLVVCSYDYKGHKGYRRVAGVCTDAWQWSAGDFEFLKKQAGDDFEQEKRNWECVKVTPGRYKAAQMFHTMRNRDKEEKTTPFAVIERIS